MSGESDLNLMISKSREEVQHRITLENQELKDCLKMLQREMFDIVKLKSDIYLKRMKAENYNANDTTAYSSEEILKHEIEKIREGLFSLPFEETSREIIHKF
jgi:DNA-nicking Smr family endonuclease